MIKNDLIRMVAKNGGFTNEEATDAVKAVLDTLKETIENGEEVELRGFGCFRIREQGPRPGRNPKTREEVMIPARKSVYFRPSKNLKIRD